MAQSIQVLSDKTVAVDLRYPHLVEAVRNNEIDLELYTKTMDTRKYSIETEELFPNVVTTTQEKEENTKALVDSSIVIFTTMLVLVLIMLMLS